MEYTLHFSYLEIPTVQVSMDRSTYQCFVSGFESTVGILFVRNECEYDF